MFVGFHDHRVGRHGDHRVEVARRQRVVEIADVVGEKRLHQREIGAQRGLEQVGLALDLDALLPFLHDGAHARGRQHAAKAEAAGADALDQRALRHEVHLQLAGEHLLLRLRVEADMARDRLLHRAGADQLADADAGERVVVGDHREVPLALAHELVHQALGRAHAHEPADHHARAVGYQRRGVLQ